SRPDSTSPWTNTPLACSLISNLHAGPYRPILEWIPVGTMAAVGERRALRRARSQLEANASVELELVDVAHQVVAGVREEVHRLGLSEDQPRQDVEADLGGAVGVGQPEHADFALEEMRAEPRPHGDVERLAHRGVEGVGSDVQVPYRNVQHARKGRGLLPEADLGLDHDVLGHLELRVAGEPDGAIHVR